MDSLGRPSRQEFSMSACVKERIHMQAIVGENFKIEGENFSQELTTDDLGCLHWNEELILNYANSEKYLKIKRIFRGSKRYPGATEVNMALNPWNPKNSPILDLRYESLNSDESNIETFQDSNSELEIQDILFHWNRERYDLFRINQWLDLLVAQEYRLLLHASLKRWTKNFGWTTENIENGSLKIAIGLFPETKDQEIDFKHPHSIRTYQSEISSGRAAADVVVEYASLVHATVRNRLLIQIQDVDQHYDAKTFETFIFPQIESGHMIAKKANIDLFAYNNTTASLQKFNELNLDKPYELFKKQYNVEDLSWDNFPNASELSKTEGSQYQGRSKNAWISKEELSLWMQNGALSFNEKFLKQLCYRIFPKALIQNTKQNDKNEFNHCLLRPEAFFQTILQNFVETILDKYPKVVGYPESSFLNLQLDSRISSENSEKRENGDTISAEIELEGAAKAIPFARTISIGAGYRKYWTHSYSEAEVQQSGVHFDFSKRFFVEERPLVISAKVRTCLSIAPRELIQFRVMQICFKDLREAKYEESYYFATQSFADIKSPWRDMYGVMGPLRFVIRGKHRFKDFIDYAQKNTLKFAFENNTSFEAEDALKAVHQSEVLGFPGVLDAPVMRHPIRPETPTSSSWMGFTPGWFTNP